jgi:hypothetical protein
LEKICFSSTKGRRNKDKKNNLEVMILLKKLIQTIIFACGKPKILTKK